MAISRSKRLPELYQAVEEYFTAREFPFETEKGDETYSIFVDVKSGVAVLTLELTLKLDTDYLTFDAGIRDLYDVSDRTEALQLINAYNAESHFLKAYLAGKSIWLGGAAFITLPIVDNVLSLALADIVSSEIAALIQPLTVA